MGVGFFHCEHALNRSNADSFLERDIWRYAAGSFSACSDSVIQECALDIVVNGRLYRSMTCSPWDIDELAVGVLYLDGVISGKEDIERIVVDMHSCRVDVRDRSHASKRADRCSRQSVERRFTVAPDEVGALISLLETQSRLFHRTGGVHSAVLAGPRGVEAWFEDIGRHSAVDKLVGWCVLNDVDPDDKALVFSGRVPYEIVSKVITMGWPLVVSPGAPTSLSIDAARHAGLTLVGFAKQGRFNVYSHPDRIRFAPTPAIAC